MQSRAHQTTTDDVGKTASAPRVIQVQVTVSLDVADEAALRRRLPPCPDDVDTVELARRLVDRALELHPGLAVVACATAATARAPDPVDHEARSRTYAVRGITHPDGGRVELVGRKSCETLLLEVHGLDKGQAVELPASAGIAFGVWLLNPP